MKNILLATVAVAALAFGSFAAAAPETYNTTPYTAAPATQSPAATPSAADTTAPADATSPDMAAAPSAMDSPSVAPAQTAAESSAAPDAAAQAYAAPDATTQEAYAQPASATSVPGEQQQQLARDAGLAGVPMTAQDVCAQRTVTLADHEGMTRAQKVENAVDRASVCRLQAVVINAPTAEANRLKRAIVAQGVPEEAITTQTASAADANVQMSFNGVATSSAQYSALFNPNYAANTYSQSSTQSDAGPGYAPSSAAPAAPAAPADAVDPNAAPDAAATPDAMQTMPEQPAPAVPTQPQY